MKEAIYAKEMIDQTCPYAATDNHDCYMQCGNHCPHFEFVPKGSFDHVIMRSEKYGGNKEVLTEYSKIILTCSGTPVILKVKEGE